MEAADKMGWVKDAFEIFIEQVRDIDFASLVIFANEAKVVFPSTQIKTRDRRLAFKRAVNSVQPGGGRNLSRTGERTWKRALS